MGVENIHDPIRGLTLTLTLFAAVQTFHKRESIFTQTLGSFEATSQLAFAAFGR